MVAFAQRAVVFAALCVGAAACKRDAPPAPPDEKPATRKAPAPVPIVDRSKSVVTVVCPDSKGAGFFTAPDRVLTRAHFTCEQPSVLLSDGRRLLARVRLSQRELDIAELDVAGGDGEPIPFADSTRVNETDDVAVPGGGTGTVRSVGRTRLGVPHYEVAYDRLPAEGSPVLDTQGRAIGLVADETLVLPIEALGPAQGWGELEQRTRSAASNEVRDLSRALQKPALATALVDANGTLHAVLLSRTTSARDVKLSLVGCSPTVKVAWEPFRVSAWFDERGRALMQFIDKNDLDIGLSMTTLEVPLEGCSGEEVRLEGADPLLHRAPIGKTDHAMAVTEVPREGAKAPGAPAQPLAALPPPSPRGAPGDGPDERMWRGRFQALRSDQDRFEQELREKQRFIDAADRGVRRSAQRSGALMVMSADERLRYDQYKKDLENADADRAVFQKRLDELEHEASNASVPREWRR